MTYEIRTARKEFYDRYGGTLSPLDCKCLITEEKVCFENYCRYDREYTEWIEIGYKIE